MRNVLWRITKIRIYLLWCMAVLLPAMFTTQIILADVQGVDKCSLENADHPQRKSVVNLLKNKTASEKSQIKSAEISRYDFKGVYDNAQYGVKVEIIGNPTPITINGQHGIELFAKAWKGTQQLGFGADGSVEIERFKIFNPPVLVDDPNEDIVREWTDSETGELKQRRLREDPVEAVKETIAHNVKLVGKEDSQIVIGKVGNTTSTFFLSGGDGLVQYANNQSWAISHDAINGHYEGGDGLQYPFGLTVAKVLVVAGGEGGGSRIGGGGGAGGYRYDAAFSVTAQAYNVTVGGGGGGGIYGDGEAGSNGGDSSFSTITATGGGGAAGGKTFTGSSGTTGTGGGGGGGGSVGHGGYSGGAGGSGVVIIAYTTSEFNHTGGNETGVNGSETWVKFTSSGTLTLSEPISTIDVSGSITINSGNEYTNSASVTLNLTATDATGVSGYYLSTSSTTPSSSDSSWVSVTSTTSYSASVSYTLSSGDGSKTVYVWYKDAAGNVSDFASDSITLDTTAPTVSITSPTSDTTYSTTNSTISLSGSASDSTSGVISVAWSNSATGSSGTASGATSWSVSNINLSSGNNSITVTATDNAGNTATDSITVSYSTDTAAPSGSITINSGASYTNTSTVTLNLSTTDATGVTGYYLSTSSTTPSSSDASWVSVTSTTSYSASVSYTLTSGDGSKTVYVWYKDAAGNVSDFASDFITLDTTAPTVSITSPTSDATYPTTSSAIDLGGSASDSTSGVSSVAWSNSATGSSGTAGGTTNWSVSNINLSEGNNSITVTATDNAGNTATDSITVTYSIPQPSPMPTAPPSSCTDDYEPNEDFQNAYGPMESGKSYEGKLCSSEDKDYFKFELENPNTIQLTLNVPSGNDYDLYLYDSSETEVSNSRTTEQTEIITHNAISTGIYYIQVFGYGGAYDEDQPYTLTGTWTASLVPTPTLTPIPTAVATPVPNPTGTPAATGVIIGSVTDAATSNPIARATVATDDGEYSATTNPAGRFSLSNIPTGNYTLTVSATGYESTSQSVTVTAGAPTQANFSLNSLVSPSPTPGASILCEVYGFVTDEDDHDLSEVNVTIKGTKDSRSALTDEDGYFEFTGLKAGKYTITYENNGYRKQSEDITLIEGESRDLGIIVMEQNIAGIIYGTVTDAENDPIESAKVKLKGKRSNAKVKEKYTTGEDGTYEFTDLEEGTYIIQAKKKGYKKAKERIKLSDGEDKEVGLVLEEK